MNQLSRLCLLAGTIGVTANTIAPITPLAAQRPAVTFSGHVLPILRSTCGECHHPDGPAPFSLLTYDEARRHATQVVAAMESGFMPPWQTEPGYGDFVGQKRPTRAELQTLKEWILDGLPEGEHMPPPTGFAGKWRLGEPDLVVKLQERYVLPADGSDVFRIFVVPIPVATRRFVRGVEFEPGNARVVHHANIRLDRTARSRELDAGDALPGYDGLLARTALFPDGHFLGWTPGQVAPLLPKGLAWTLDPGTDLVLQLHMQPSGKPEDVQPSVGFYFGTDPPARHLAMLRLGRQDIDIAAGEAHYALTDRYTLPVDVEVQAVQPHAHYRAREVRGTATLPDGSSKTLIYITHWNFRWQHLYRYQTPFKLPKGTVLSMQYTYDNSAANPANPTQPPARVQWGQRSAEEMGDLWIQVLTANDADLLALNKDFRPKAVREDLIGYEGMIQRSPSDVGLHNDAAVLYLELGEFDKARSHFAAVAQFTPAVASAHFNLATTLTLANQVDAATAEFERAIGIDSRYDKAYYGLGILKHQIGDRAGAIKNLRQAIALNAEWLAPLIDLSWILATSSEATTKEQIEAIGYAERATTLTARQDPAVLDTLGVAYAAAGRFDDAVAAASEALAENPAPSLAADIRARLARYQQKQAYKP